MMTNLQKEFAGKYEINVSTHYTGCGSKTDVFIEPELFANKTRKECEDLVSEICTEVMYELIDFTYHKTED